TLGGIVQGTNPEGVVYSLNPFRVDDNGISSPGLAARSAANPGLCFAAASRLFAESPVVTLASNVETAGTA
ncbi:MAG: hypothetical protein JXA73_00440, partial [Acidobacteria bacterium]|nr:hypothetical protein [Acidobacteriota bacterium]